MNNLAKNNTSLVWHPFTPIKGSARSIEVAHASGSYIYDTEGKSYLDAISSWWVNLHGHAHPHITARLKEQLDKFHQVIFAGCTHRPAIELCERLSSLVPIESPHFFFSDNGSTSIEVALKIAIQYAKQNGHSEKSRFLYLENAYHGDTFGAMSVGERGFFSEPFSQYLFQGTPIKSPANNHADTLSQLKHECEKGDALAFIYEPLIQGSSGMRMYEPETLLQMLSICKKHSVITIADEVFTGFGRTGKLFASDYVEIAPDIICLSKALTGGTLPLGLTVSSEEIWNAFNSDKKEKMLLHGHSFTGNPLSCTAALAGLDLIESADFWKNITRINDYYAIKQNEVAAWPHVEDVRHRGLVFACNIEAPDEGYQSKVKDLLYPYFIENGVLLRPLGNCIYLVPPVCMSNDELDTVFSLIKSGLTKLINR